MFALVEALVRGRAGLDVPLLSFDLSMGLTTRVLGNKRVFLMNKERFEVFKMVNSGWWNGDRVGQQFCARRFIVCRR